MQMDPQLKRLLKWARAVPAQTPQEAPWGFSHRVVQNWLESEPYEAFGMWQSAVVKSAWVSAAIILAGLALLTVQRVEEKSGYNLPTASYELVSTRMVP